MIRVYMAIVRKFVNQDLTRILRNIFSQIESLTGGTDWTRELLMPPAWTVSKIDWIKLGAQGWVSSWTSALNPRPCHVGWPQDKAAQGNHKASTWCVENSRLPTSIWSITSEPTLGRYASYCVNSVCVIHKCRSATHQWSRVCHRWYSKDA